MAGKLQGNGIFESSRMILPEHRDAFVERELQKKKRKKPHLDEQELQTIQEIFVNSYHQRECIAIELFYDFENQFVEGIVCELNVLKREIRLMLQEDDYQRIPMDRIVGAHTL